MSILNENIRFLRQKEGFKSARLFAEYLGEKPGQVSEYESRRQPNRDFLAKIAEKFKIDLNLFMSEKLTDKNYSRLFAEKNKGTLSEPLKDLKKVDDFFKLASQVEEENNPVKRKQLVQELISLYASKLNTIDELKDEIMRQLREKEDLLKKL